MTILITSNGTFRFIWTELSKYIQRPVLTSRLCFATLGQSTKFNRIHRARNVIISAYWMTSFKGLKEKMYLDCVIIFGRTRLCNLIHLGIILCLKGFEGMYTYARKQGIIDIQLDQHLLIQRSNLLRNRLDKFQGRALLPR